MKYLSITKIKDILDIINKLMVMLAIIVGGFWTYYLFFEFRDPYPKAITTQRIKHYTLSSDKYLVRVNISFQNTGKVLLSLIEGVIQIEQVLPMSQRIKDNVEVGVKKPKANGRFSWPVIKLVRSDIDKLKKGAIEPGEFHEDYYEFVISSKYELINVYSRFTYEPENSKNRLWWNMSNLYALERKGVEK